ncbi:hypothetical protein Dhaf_3985 [Desulfitobacterium hafniense DCB-2]|uniref:Uncharacterized protein n=2 Tax=root TaxID=1 RepID=B8FSY2_DESHD|nr:hypothetical protein [Desulfitobacterium hafniense]ACL21998.1 hypothetical protein Dhaf_3985 [Desulfitobacterium hafniense DCB-2]MEA5022373.1 hypothetical protein [Desulfitobacterium hafniense]
MKIVIQFCVDADIIDCPVDISDSLIEYRNKFIDWLYDKQNNHSYWIYKNGEKYGCSYRSEAFVEWLNKFVLSNSLVKAKVLESNVKNWDNSLLSTGF